MFHEKEPIVKDCFVLYNQNTEHILQLQIIKELIAIEAKAILKCKMIGTAIPTLYLIDLEECSITMENLTGLSVQDFLIKIMKIPKQQINYYLI